MILVISAFSGLVRAQAPGPVIMLSGLSPVTVGVGSTTTLTLTITGGYVDASHKYTVSLFEGKTNSSAVQATVLRVTPNGGCTSYLQNCSQSYPTTVQLSVSYAWPGSYDLSVTVNDSTHDYSILTDPVTVTSTLSINCVEDFQTVGQSATIVGLPITFTATTLNNVSAIYLWDFGDGTSAYAQLVQAPEYIGSTCHTNTAATFPVFHTYTGPGDYVVTLTASNMFGAADRAYTIPLTIRDPLPQIHDDHIPSSASTNSATFFFANATDANPSDLTNLTFAWSFNGGTSWVISHPVLTSSSMVMSEVSHTFTATGTSTVWVEAFNEYGNVTANPTKTTNQIKTASVSVSNPVFTQTCSSSGSSVVGQATPFPIGACTTVSGSSALLNATWMAPGGKEHGLTGQLRSYAYGYQSFPVYLNKSSGGSVAAGTAAATFTDVAPIVGATSLTVTPTITLSIPGGGHMFGSCIFSSIDATLYNGSTDIAQGSILCGQTSVTLPVQTLFLGNSYTLQVQYNPVGGSSTTPATLSYSYLGNGSAPRQYSWTFDNSNPLTWTWSQDVDSISLGEPITVGTTVFSFADVSLTTTWFFGDGNSFQTVTPAPSQIGPTRVVISTTHTWGSGQTYDLLIQTTDPVSGAEGGLTGQDAISVIEVGDLTVNDTAPQSAISAPSAVAESNATSIAITPEQADGGAGATTVAWYFGDGTTGSGTSIDHSYEYSGVYPVVAITSSPSGSESATFDLLNVVPAPVFPSINCTPTNPLTYTLVTCSATNTTIGSNGLSKTAISWDFGDGTVMGGPVGVDGVVPHVFTSTGSATVTLTVESGDGVTAVSSSSISLTAPGTSIGHAPSTATADVREGAWVTPGSCSIFVNCPSGTGFWNVSWNWGGGWPTGLSQTSANKFGLSEGDTYVIPGTYTETATIKNVMTGALYTPTQQVVVKDYPMRVALPYTDGVVYGENHSANFAGKAMGGYYDSWGPPLDWNFTWSWGDGSSSVFVSSLTNQTTASHWYNTTGPELLGLSVGGPEPLAYRTNGSATANLMTLLDTDGDGLPNAFEAAVTNTSPYYADSADKTGAWGVGLTDFQAGALNGLLSNLSADQDGDGLTSMQEILGSVTGYPSNPLDANTAGDGIPDGGHFFTDSFRAASIVNLPSGVHWTYIPIPNVGYLGNPSSFNQSRLVVQINATSYSHVSLNLVTRGGLNLSLPAPNNFTDTYYLLNQSPIAGSHSSVSHALTLLDYSPVGNWTLVISTTTGFAGGSIPSAYVQDSYYTNPSLADPYHQGMLEGSSLTVPVFNCSEPQNSNYTSFDPTRLTITKVTYYPYTEQYKKLSYFQGIPYAQGTNSSVAQNNSRAPSCDGVPSAHFGDVATYLGDADFGISPWNVHAAGDSVLTNGMKALGAARYNATVWMYENTGGRMSSTPGSNPYPADRVKYMGSMNPMALSSAGDGLKDSSAPDPVAPLVLGVRINYASDPACITTDATYTDVVGVTLLGQSSPTVFTPGVAGTMTQNTASCGTLGSAFGYNTNFLFSFYDSYTMPVDNSLSSFMMQFTLYHNALVNAPSDWTVTLTGSLTQGTIVYSAPGDNLNVSATVLTMPRVNTILSNTTEELTNLPGYGLRYTGEQEFYAFYVNLGSNPPTKFSTGTNLILESRKAFLASPMAAWLKNDTLSGLSCLGSAGAQVTRTPGPSNFTPSQTGIAGTFSVDLASNPSCASTLLANLAAKNATGVVIGQSQVLNSTQIDLLGLDTQIAQLTPYEPPSGWNSPIGGPPNGILTGWVEQTATYFIGGLVALANFITSVSHLVVALGQWFLGAILSALGQVAAAAQAAATALSGLLNLVAAIAKALASSLFAPLYNGVQAQLLFIWTNLQTAAKNYNQTGSVTLVNATNLWKSILLPLVALTLGISAAITIMLLILEGFTLGTFSIVSVIVTTLLTGALYGLSQYINYGGVSFSNSLISPGLVSAAETTYSQSQGGGHALSSSCWAWATLGAVATTGIDGYAAGSAVEDILALIGNRPAVLLGAMPLALIAADAVDVASLIWDAVIYSQHWSGELATISILLGFAGFGLTAFAFFFVRPPAINSVVSPALYANMKVSLALDIAALGTSITIAYALGC